MDGNYYSSYQNGVEKKDFNKISQNVGSSIQKISQNVLSMKKMVNLLGTSQDNQELRQKLHQIQHYTNQLAKDTTSRLKELSTIAMPQSPSEQREHKMLKERLAEELTTTLNAFQEMQRLACQKERDEMHKTREAHPYTGVRIPPPPTSRAAPLTANEAQLIELQDSFQQKQMQAQFDEEQRNLEIIQQQEEAIRQLENDISTVNEIFMDLGALVHNQGEIIDSIEAQVETAEVSVSMGNENLRKANTIAVLTDISPTSETSVDEIYCEDISTFQHSVVNWILHNKFNIRLAGVAFVYNESRMFYSASFTRISEGEFPDYNRGNIKKIKEIAQRHPLQEGFILYKVLLVYFKNDTEQGFRWQIKWIGPQ